MTKVLSAKAYAKINLFLDVVGKRDNGYHNIESIMQSVSLHDIITITSCDSSDSIITVSCNNPDVPTDERNIVYKCAKAFFEHYGIAKYSININIEKNIMAQAGLGGGSSDGAVTLQLLNHLFEVNASEEELCKIGGKIGADIPFCILGGTCKVCGIGEILTPIEIPSPAYSVLIAFSESGVSTAEAYKELDKIAYESSNINNVINELSAGVIPVSLYNVFEKVILCRHGEASKIKEKMMEFGAESTIMSGSGPSIIGLFKDKKTCISAKESFKLLGIRSACCEAVLRAD